MSERATLAFQEINRQLFEYAIASDSHDWQRLGALFTHGRYHFADAPGSDAVVRWGNRVIKDTARTQHAISTVSIELDDHAEPTRAAVRNYLSLFAVDDSGIAELVSASWFDNEFAVIGDAWRWRTHRITPIFRGNWTLMHRSQQFAAVPGTSEN
jgi:SnoaL-like domain